MTCQNQLSTYPFDDFLQQLYAASAHFKFGGFYPLCFDYFGFSPGFNIGQTFLIANIMLTYHPAPVGLELHGPVAVHGGLEELAGPQVPEQHQANPRPFTQNRELKV